MSDITRKLTVLSCLLFTGFCFWKAALGLVDVLDVSVVSTTEAAVSPSFSHKRGITTPIQDMRPGMRIVGRNLNRLETESVIDPTPEGWRLVSVRMEHKPGEYLLGKLLRPKSWIRGNQAQPGAVIQLEIPEMNVAGSAEVLAIKACPPIKDGPGSVVTGTFEHVSDNVISVFVEGEDEPIGTTAKHPFWSKDQAAFIPAGELRIGEELKTALGTSTRVTSIEIRAGPETVYGLEIAGEHVYQIADAGLLVHNASGRSGGNAPRVGDGRKYTNLINNVKNPHTGKVDSVKPGKKNGLASPHGLNIKLRDKIGGNVVFRNLYQTRSGKSLPRELVELRKSSWDNITLGDTERLPDVNLHTMAKAGDLTPGMHIDMVGINPMCGNCFGEMSSLVSELGVTL